MNLESRGIPPMPPEASTWALNRTLGRDAMEAAWAGCFDAGRTAGRIEAEVGYATGIAHASVGWGAVVVFALIVGAVVSAFRRDR